MAPIRNEQAKAKMHNGCRKPHPFTINSIMGKASKGDRNVSGCHVSILSDR